MSDERLVFSYNAPVHLEVLKTLLTSSSCPRAVLTLSAPNVLRLFPDPFPQHSKRVLQAFDPRPIRQAARRALSLPTEGSSFSTQSIMPAKITHISSSPGRNRALDTMVASDPPTRFQRAQRCTIRTRPRTRHRPLSAHVPAHEVPRGPLGISPARGDDSRHGGSTPAGNFRTHDPSHPPRPAAPTDFPAPRSPIARRVRGPDNRG